MEKNKAIFIILMIFSSSLIITGVSIISNNAKALLISPRFGAPMRASPTVGSNSSLDWLENEISIIVGMDPADLAIPTAWLNKQLWNAKLSSSIIENSTLYELEITKIQTISNPFVSKGSFDSSYLAMNAVALSAKIPGNIPPGLYNIYISFKKEINQAIEVEGGSIVSNKGVATLIPNSFTLSEANCIYIPWINDPVISEKNPDVPFSFLQITDVHVALSSNNQIIPDNYPHLDNFRQASSVLAPDVIIATGDLTNSPDDYPNEYKVAYNYYKSLGIPIIMDNGNHDQGNLGLYGYYFGPTQSNINWANITFISFNGALPLSSQQVNWIVNGIKDGTSNGNPVFLCDHYPILDVFGRQMSGSQGTILDAMIRYNATACISGHNHYNLVMDAEKALNSFLTFGDLESACEIPPIIGTSAAEFNSPKIIITTSTAKGSRTGLKDEGLWPNYQNYEGYRRYTFADNRLVNYTYDYNEDGLRDPSYSHPAFYLNRTLILDPDIGESTTAKAELTIKNNLSETIFGGSAKFLIPNAPEGFHWEISNGISAIERLRISNSTHTYLDFRLNIPAKSNLVVELLPVIGGD